MANRRAPLSVDLPSAELLQRVIACCHERRAECVVSLDVRELVEYMDAMVIVTGRSSRQNRAIAAHVLTQLKRESGILPLSKAGVDAGAWICLDLVDVVLHIFDADARAHYDLELLWSDAVRTEHDAPPEAPGQEGDVGMDGEELEEAEELRHAFEEEDALEVDEPTS